MDTPLTIADVAKRLSNRGRPVCRGQVYRWIKEGVKVKGYKGPPIRLRCLQLPGGVAFTEAQLQEFCDRLLGARGAVNHDTGELRHTRGAAPCVLAASDPAAYPRAGRPAVGTYPPLTPGRALRLARDGARDGARDPAVDQPPAPEHEAQGQQRVV